MLVRVEGYRRQAQRVAGFVVPYERVYRRQPAQRDRLLLHAHDRAPQPSFRPPR